jgi:hypothetical protein
VDLEKKVVDLQGEVNRLPNTGLYASIRAQLQAAIADFQARMAALARETP